MNTPGTTTVIDFTPTQKTTSGGARIIKRAFDLAALISSAIFWLPLCLIIAALIWLEDRKNPLFLQERIGKEGKVFKTWKFRTMVPNADEVLAQKLEEDPALREEWEMFYKLRNDPRITKMGHFLRRTSLDEIPQLVNVFKGEMSLVGPRPLPRYHYEVLPAHVRALREQVQPGLTGLWQVSGRSDAGTEGMEISDPAYVKNWSLGLDFKILIKTVSVVVKGTGAY